MFTAKRVVEQEASLSDSLSYKCPLGEEIPWSSCPTYAGGCAWVSDIETVNRGGEFWLAREKKCREGEEEEKRLEFQLEQNNAETGRRL